MLCVCATVHHMCIPRNQYKKKSDDFQRWISWLVYRWRTLRTAIRNVNCTTQWIIETLNAYCAARAISEHAWSSVFSNITTTRRRDWMNERRNSFRFVSFRLVSCRVLSLCSPQRACVRVSFTDYTHTRSGSLHIYTQVEHHQNLYFVMVVRTLIYIHTYSHAGCQLPYELVVFPKPSIFVISGRLLKCIERRTKKCSRTWSRMAHTSLNLPALFSPMW